MRGDRIGRIAFGLAIIAFMASTIYCDIEQNGRIKALEKKNEVANRQEDHSEPLPRVDGH